MLLLRLKAKSWMLMVGQRDVAARAALGEKQWQTFSGRKSGHRIGRLAQQHGQGVGHGFAQIAPVTDQVDGAFL